MAGENLELYKIMMKNEEKKRVELCDLVLKLLQGIDEKDEKVVEDLSKNIKEAITSKYGRMPKQSTGLAQKGVDMFQQQKKHLEEDNNRLQIEIENQKENMEQFKKKCKDLTEQLESAIKENEQKAMQIGQMTQLVG